MTAHSHDQSTHLARRRDGPTPAVPAATGSNRPRWLVPALVGGTVIGFLVLYGVLSPTAVLYGGLIGGMLLMHAGGHGGHGGHGGRGARGAGNLRNSSSGTQGAGSDSEDELDDRASTEESGSETHDHDRRSSHGCH